MGTTGDDASTERTPSPVEVARPLIHRITRELAARATVFVALDGRSGAGKSTVSAAVAATINLPAADPIVTVVDGDQFYAGGSAGTWDRRTPADRADRVIDWRRQRTVLEQLRSDGESTWHPFDWDSEEWDSDQVPRRSEPVRTRASPVVILEGAYSARPELGDLIDLRVLLDTPSDIRRRQLLDREGEKYRADWEARWSEAEDHYFETVMPAEHFDLVVDGAPPRRFDTDTVRRFVGVYDAKGTMSGEIAYWIGARLGRAHCALCDITHGLFRERRDWRDRRADLPIPFEAIHLDERDDDLVRLTDGHTPCIVAETDTGSEIVLGPVELERCAGSAERLVDTLLAAIADR